MASIGEKVCRLRKEKHMTQAALAGDRITRNMLSQIENGAASPSVSTILYLAQRLEMPAGYFLSPDEDETYYLKYRIFGKLKQLFREKEYDSCLRLASQIENPDDELCMMLSVCCFRLGKEEYHKGRLKKAKELFSQCMTYADKSMYPSACTRLAANYKDAIDACMKENPSGFPFIFPDCQSENGGADGLGMICSMIAAGEMDLAASFLNRCKQFSPALRTMLQAAMAEKKCLFSDCLSLLNMLREQDLDAVNRCRACRMGERCAAASGDFEAAYRYAKRRERLEKAMLK